VYDFGNTITFGLYDMLGREVRDLTPLLVNHSQDVVLDISGLEQGVYYYTLTTPHGYYSKALTIAR
jgi:hypothetical protein